MEFNVDGVRVTSTKWVDGEGRLHREGGPAIVSRDACGYVHHVYCIHGQIHREGGKPAVQEWFRESLICEEYWERGVISSITGNSGILN